MNELFKDLPDGWYQWNVLGLRHLFCEIYDGKIVRNINNWQAPGKEYAGHRYLYPVFPAWPTPIDASNSHNRLNLLTLEHSLDFNPCDPISPEYSDLFPVEMPKPELETRTDLEIVDLTYDIF